MNILPESYLLTRKTDLILQVIRVRIRIEDFSKDSTTLRDGAFLHSLSHTSGNTDRENFIICPDSGEGSPHYVIRRPDYEFEFPFGIVLRPVVSLFFGTTHGN